MTDLPFEGLDGSRHVSHEFSIASLFLLMGAPSATAQSLPIFLSAPAVQNDCGRPAASFALPGSASCVRVGGSVWAAATFARVTPMAVTPAPPAGRVVEGRSIARSSQRLQARVSFDARTETPYGPIRAYVSVRAR